MKQCDHCSGKVPDFYVSGCAVLDTPIKERHFCLSFDDPAFGIPEEYWNDEEKCPYFMDKEVE